MMTALITGAAIIIIALAGYAGWLHYQLWLQKRLREKAASEVLAFDPALASENRVELRKTLYVLADALLNEKMTHTEGCLRICAMASHLEDIDGFRREYGVLFRVAEATAHFPILDDWQALSKEEKKRFTKERKDIEEKYREAVVEAVERVRRNFY